MRRGARTTRAALVAAALLTAAGPAAAQTAGAGDSARRAVRPRTLYEDLQLFTGVLNQIRVNHADSVDVHALVMAAIRGMVHEADPYSGVVAGLALTPERERLMRDGKLVPVPITFAYVDGTPVVAAVAPGSAASRLDILPGDELVAADGRPVLAESVPELGVSLGGASKSTVRLTFSRARVDGSRVTVERVVRRESLGEATNVPVAFMLDPRTGYVRITGFENTRVSDDLHDALARLERGGMSRLVLDLRDNPGGMITEASAVAGEFLPKGAVVYTSFGRKKELIDTGRVSRSFFRSEKRYPIVLLVNGGSASAAELVAGALQDHDRALVVGRPTHGKALMMVTLPIADNSSALGSSVYLNVGRVRTPCGRVVQRDYHGVSRREYFRRAGSVVDTAGRPSCKTSRGRTVYGGGGVYPDVLLPERTMPPWLSRVNESGLLLRWVGPHVAAHPSSYPSVDALVARPALAPGGLTEFRTLAAGQGVELPTGAEADQLLERLLLGWVADARFGEAGYYRAAATLDGEVKAAVGAFDAAEGILKR